MIVFNVSSPGGRIVNCRLLPVLRCFCSRLVSRAHILMINLEEGLNRGSSCRSSCSKRRLSGWAQRFWRSGGMRSSCPMVICSAGEAWKIRVLHQHLLQFSSTNGAKIWPPWDGDHASHGDRDRHPCACGSDSCLSGCGSNCTHTCEVGSACLSRIIL
jgi:hypothetical protein